MGKSNLGRKYGCKKQEVDIRDKKFPKVKFFKAMILPPSVDLRPAMPPVYDQGTIGSCVANSIGANDQYEQIIQKIPDAFMPSRLAIYYGGRELENNINEDSGMQIRDGIKFVAASGVCPETMWPYDVSKFAQRPPQECYDYAACHTVSEYLSLDNTDITQLKKCLVDGFPFVFGFSVYESFESPAVAASGMMPIPKPHEVYIGEHAILAVGYDDSIKCFIIRNSWGDNWGKNGYFFMPYSIITNPKMASGFWTIRVVNDLPVPTKPTQTTATTPVKSFWQRLFSWL